MKILLAVIVVATLYGCAGGTLNTCMLTFPFTECPPMSKPQIYTCQPGSQICHAGADPAPAKP